ncbi:hypothetical protein SLE2022_352490 [Rubroshorea leprosula]
MPWSPVGYLTPSIGYFPFWFRSNAIDPSSYCVKSTLLATMSAPMASAGVWRADLVPVRPMIRNGSCWGWTMSTSTFCLKDIA